MTQSTLPRLMDIEEVAEYLDVSVDTLNRFRMQSTGPNYVKVGNGIRYLESDVLEYIQSQRQLPPIDGSKAATPAAIAAAMLEGSAGRRAANAGRNAEMVALDKADREGDGNPYAVTMGTVGDTPGAKMERHFNVPPVPFNNAPSPHIIKGR